MACGNRVAWRVMSPEPRPTLHRISKFEQRLTEALLECAVRDSPDALNAVYRANGLDRDIATRADVLFLAIAVTRSALNFGFRHLSRFRRAEEDCEAILVELDQSALSESVDPLAARQLLRWACRVTSEGEDFPRFPRDDSTAKTYIVVAAA